MVKAAYLGLMVFAGFMIGFQSPINAVLSRRIGVLESSLLSFLGGTIVLAVLVFLFGSGELGAVQGARWWECIGGVLGAIVVVNTVLCVPQLGVLTTLMAMIFGNLLIGALIDHFGWFGVETIPFDLTRLIGFAFVLGGILLAAKK